MSKISILSNTFREEKPNTSIMCQRLVDIVDGQVDIQIDNKLVTAWAWKSKSLIRVLGFIGKYRTSNKPWAASVYVYLDSEGKEHTTGFFGRDDRSNRFHKMQGIIWDPVTYFKINN